MDNAHNRLPESQAAPAREGQSNHSTQNPSGGESDRPIDLEALARCVYDMLKREMRIERERLGIGS